MVDYCVKSAISNGSMSVKDLISYAERNNIKQLGIVELEEIPEQVSSPNINVVYGTEILSDNLDLSVVVFDIKNANDLQSMIADNKIQNQKCLISCLKKILNNSPIFENYLKSNSFLSINKAVSFLIKLGVCKDFKSSIQLLYNNNAVIRPDIFNQIKSFCNCGNIFLKSNNYNFVIDNFDKIIKQNLFGILICEKINDNQHKNLLNLCNANNLSLLLGTGFDNHKTGDIIGVK